MGFACEKISYFFALILLVLILSLVTTSVISDSWFFAVVRNNRGLPVGESSVKAGLFKGERIIDWGLGERRQEFSVLDEISDDVSFMNRYFWAAVIFFTALGILFLFISLFTVIICAVSKKKRNSIAGPCGIYVWNTLAMISLALACVTYFANFADNITNNVLLDDQLQRGFSSDGQAKLSTSFYMMIIACVSTLLPTVLICCCQRSAKKNHKLNINNGSDPAVMYY